MIVSTPPHEGGCLKTRKIITEFTYKNIAPSIVGPIIGSQCRGEIIRVVRICGAGNVNIVS